MKFRIQLKDPDGVSYALDEALAGSLAALEGELTEEERDELRESRREELVDATRKWIEWEEYVTVEIDINQGTAVVVPVGE